jgi:hypothetical protein
LDGLRKGNHAGVVIPCSAFESFFGQTVVEREQAFGPADAPGGCREQKSTSFGQRSAGCIQRQEMQGRIVVSLWQTDVGA